MGKPVLQSKIALAIQVTFSLAKRASGELGKKER
jgi:hypothetical protein